MAAPSMHGRIFVKFRGIIPWNYQERNLRCTFVRNISISESKRCTQADKDPFPIFTKPDVQDILKILTRFDIKRTFRLRKLGKKLVPAEYKFLTTEELNEYMENSKKKAEEKMQMPPVVKEWAEVDEVLFKDPYIQGFDPDKSKYVFTDISMNKNDVNRLIVARDANGTLRKATQDERRRMNQIYFPKLGRKLRVPEMFDGEFLKGVLENSNYEFLLDRACIQFEPNDPQYKKVTSSAYDHIDNSRQYDALRSTRHFGPFVFHLAWNKRIDNLLLDLINTERIDEAGALVKLYYIINPKEQVKITDEMSLVKAYVKNDSSKRATLELAIQTYEELKRQKEEIDTSVKKAHGMTV